LPSGAIITDVAVRTARTARLLWIIFAFLAWNVVFDRVLVLEGRRYVHAAATAARESRPYVLVDPWMRAAQRRAVWTASAVGGGILVVGLVAVGLADRPNAESLKSAI
jgi:hypothetical protein